ncbi:MAG: iron dicitrate transport regulator FecR [Bradyrhizobiaceae bacterium PARB1]|nr:MAG: iron dicitrate transport regulator FecR [Bradyrhizobiaceae bacterium PARB1]
MSDTDIPAEPEHPNAKSERIDREARDWAAKLGARQLSVADLAALERWRMASREHRRALAKANLLWDVLGKVVHEARAQDTARRSVRASGPLRMPSRRVFFAGAVAASAAYLVVKPPLHLWPSASEWTAPHRTGTGERRQLAVASGVSVELDSQTSVSEPVTADRHTTLELISGQLAVSVKADARQAVLVAARGGESRADQANFDVKCVGASVWVTCVDGEVETSFRTKRIVLKSGQQVSYGNEGISGATTIDPSVATAWQRGLLVFRDVPLEQVVDEVNRYRAGKIILVNNRLSQRRVMAGFRLDQIDEVVGYLSNAFGARTRHLPGGIVLVS